MTQPIQTSGNSQIVINQFDFNSVDNLQNLGEVDLGALAETLRGTDVDGNGVVNALDNTIIDAIAAIGSTDSLEALTDDELTQLQSLGVDTDLNPIDMSNMSLQEKLFLLMSKIILAKDKEIEGLLDDVEAASSDGGQVEIGMTRVKMELDMRGAMATLFSGSIDKLSETVSELARG